MRYAHSAALAAAFFAFGVSPVMAGCTIYQHSDYAGSSWWLGDHEHLIMTEGEDYGCTTNGHGGQCDSAEYEPSWNDHVSSFQVDPGCTITLWEHVNQEGAHFRTYRSYTYIGDDWNDTASEAYCVCTG